MAAHGSQIDHGRHAREVLHQHPAGSERDLARRLGLRLPAGQGLNVVRADALAVLGPQQIFQQNLQSERQSFGLRNGFLHAGEAVDRECLIVDSKSGLTAE
jgi:hypothetical protein